MSGTGKNSIRLTALIPQVYWEFIDGGDVKVYEAEAELTEREEMEYKKIIGDGCGHLSTSVGFAFKHYGEGTSVNITVAMTCDQSEKGYEDAALLSRAMSQRVAIEAVGEAQEIFESLNKGER